MEPRKASDILLELETKSEIILNLVRTQDLNIKILSNKVNELNEKIKQLTTQSTMTPPVKVEVVETPSSTLISNENSLPQETSPKGFRRTSRPETYAGDDKYLSNSNVETTVIPKFPTQIPKISKPLADPEIVVPSKNIKQSEDLVEISEKKSINANSIPIVQRVVNRSGKSVFLADIEIIDLATMNNVSKTRTNGTGKWMTSLPVGKYRVFIKKRESVSKDILEVTQDIVIDGSQSPLELKTIIIQ